MTYRVGGPPRWLPSWGHPNGKPSSACAEHVNRSEMMLDYYKHVLERQHPRWWWCRMKWEEWMDIQIYGLMNGAGEDSFNHKNYNSTNRFRLRAPTRSGTKKTSPRNPPRETLKLPRPRHTETAGRWDVQEQLTKLFCVIGRVVSRPAKTQGPRATLCLFGPSGGTRLNLAMSSGRSQGCFLRAHDKLRQS